MGLSDSLSSSINFPRHGYMIYLLPVLSFRDEEGLSSCVICPCQHAVANTPPVCNFPFQSIFGDTCCLRSTTKNSATGYLWINEATYAFIFITACRLTHLAETRLYLWAPRFSFLPPSPFSYWASTSFTQVGLTPTEHIHLFWTHNS